MAINVAKDMYEKGQKQLEDFSTKYGDFMTPILKDQDWYDKNVTGAARDLINNIYANGGDPLRDAASRAAISRFIYSLPTGDISKVKQSSENAKIYLQNLGKLKAAGKYNEDFAKFLGEDLNGWDTINGGDIWTLTSPTEMQTLKEATEPWYNNRTPHDLDKAGVESFGMQYDPRYQWTGFTKKDLLDIAAGNTPGWYGTPYADYYREKAKQKLEATGQPFTEADVEKQLQADVAQANEEYLVAPTKHADQFALQQQQFNNQWDLQRDQQRHQIEMARNNKDENSLQYSLAENIKRNAMVSILGKDIMKYGDIQPNEIRDAQMKFGQKVSKDTGNRSVSDKGFQQYKSKFSNTTESPLLLAEYMSKQGFEKDPDDNNSILIYAPKDDGKKANSLYRLQSLKQVASNTQGFRGPHQKTNYDWVKDYDVIRLRFDGDVYGAYTKDANFKNLFGVTVQVGTREETVEGNKKVVTYKYKDLDGDFYFDSHITTKRDNPEAGYLGTVGRNGKVNDIYGIGTNATLDPLLMNQQFADLQTSKAITGNTEWNVEAVLPYMPKWGGNPLP